MATNQPLPSGPVKCRQCGNETIEGWVSGHSVSEHPMAAEYANLMWIDKQDEFQFYDLTEYRFRHPPKVLAYRCDRCGIVELHFPPGVLAERMNPE